MREIIKYELKQISRTKLLWIGIGFLVILRLISHSSEPNSDLRDFFQYSYNSQHTVILYVAIICGSLAAYVASREIHNDNVGVIMTTRVKPLQYIFGKLFACGIITAALQFIMSFPMFLYWSFKEHTFFDSVSTSYFFSSFFLHEIMLYLPFALFIMIISYCLNVIFFKWRLGLIFPTIYILFSAILPGTHYLPWLDFRLNPYTYFADAFIESLSPDGQYLIIRVLSPISLTSTSVMISIIISMSLVIVAITAALICLERSLGRGHFVSKEGIENNAAV